MSSSATSYTNDQLTKRIMLQCISYHDGRFLPVLLIWALHYIIHMIYNFLLYRQLQNALEISHFSNVWQNLSNIKYINKCCQSQNTSRLSTWVSHKILKYSDTIVILYLIGACHSYIFLGNIVNWIQLAVDIYCRYLQLLILTF